MTTLEHSTDLAGKVVVITGGSRGLGLSMAEGFAHAGSSVVVASRKVENCEAVASRLTAQHGVRALGVEFNVSEWDACERLTQTCYDEFGRVDVLINNAGLSPLYPSLTAVSEQLWDKTLAVNVKGPFRLAALIADRMVAGEGGSILNISSVEAVRPTPRALPYAIAKAGLNVMTHGMAEAYGPAVRVNALQCGPFLTDISDHWTDEIRDYLERTVYLGRAGAPDEITGAALFLASSAASFITGAVLPVDGGFP